jgi:hypothetical protein
MKSIKTIKRDFQAASSNVERSMMSELMKIGLVKQDVSIGGRDVEYAVIFRNEKVLPTWREQRAITFFLQC